MKVLVIGGAGYVGSIVRPALEREHDVTHYDLRPVAGSESRTIVGDINNQALLQKTFAETRFDAVVHMAMGVSPQAGCDDVHQAFAVNVCGTYLTARLALAAGVRKLVYASTLSVFTENNVVTGDKPRDESTPPNSWEPYGFTKRLAERVLEGASQQCPDCTITALRLYQPRNEIDWPVFLERTKGQALPQPCTGPQDTRRLFLAALAVTQPGFHLIHTVGNANHPGWPMTRARTLLGWTPVGE